MTNTLLFSYCTCLCFSGFVFAFYRALADSKISFETKKGMQKGYSFDNDKGAEYYAKKFRKWSTGKIFAATNTVFFGLFICAIASLLNLKVNSWWSSLFVILIGYFLYVIISGIIGFRVQVLSLVSGIASLTMIVITLIDHF